MNYELHSQVVQRLVADYEFKNRGRAWMQEGRCPACGQKELFIREESPRVMICGRENNCGNSWHVKDLYPDLFEDWSKRAPATPANPTATAQAYLAHNRGFSLELIAGWYSQENYWNHQLGIGSATVRFPLRDGGHWERLIDRPERFGKQKALFKKGYSYAGYWWCPPSVDLKEVDELWLVEGIFDSIALLHHGIAAVATLTSGNFPAEALKELIKLRNEADKRLPRLIWALDNEPGARKNMRKFAKRADELGFICRAALIPQRGKNKADWNDIHQRWEVFADEDERAKRIEQDKKEFRHQGNLLLVESAEEKGVLMYDWTPRSEFSFSFRNRLYWFKFDLDRYDRTMRDLESSESLEDQNMNDRQRRMKALRQSGSVKRIANCTFDVLYFMENQLTEESWYYLRVERPRAPAVRRRFTPGHLASAPEFKKQLMSVDSGTMYTGNQSQLERMLEAQFEELKKVQTINWVGYSIEYGAYIFNDLAIANGQVYNLNEEDFFDIGKLSVKTQSMYPVIDINHRLNEYNEEWFELFWQCFGVQGCAVLAWWLGSLYAEQIRRVQKSYLFLELVGEAGAGKTTLLELLWKLSGRTEYEGLDPLRSSNVGRARSMSQVGNLPVALIESDRESADGGVVKQFDWDELKPLYNGRDTRTTGVKNSGNETSQSAFRASIMIAQNQPIKASEAMLQRLAHVGMTKNHHTPQAKLMAEKLERMPIEQVSGFMLKALLPEKEILALLDSNTSAYEQQLLARPDIRTVRIAKNHAQLLSLVDALKLVVPLGDARAAQVREEVVRMAEAREQAIEADHPIVREFWDMYEFLDGAEGEGKLNHSRNQGYIAVNLNEFVEMAANKRQQIPALSDLKRLLKTSKVPRFVEANKAVNSAQRTDAFNKPRTVRCWMFQQV